MKSTGTLALKMTFSPWPGSPVSAKNLLKFLLLQWPSVDLFRKKERPPPSLPPFLPPLIYSFNNQLHLLCAGQGSLLETQILGMGQWCWREAKIPTLMELILC
jgi:hypothetical protein